MDACSERNRLAGGYGDQCIDINIRNIEKKNPKECDEYNRVPVNSAVRVLVGCTPHTLVTKSIRVIIL